MMAAWARRRRRPGPDRTRRDRAGPRGRHGARCWAAPARPQPPRRQPRRRERRRLLISARQVLARAGLPVVDRRRALFTQADLRRWRRVAGARAATASSTRPTALAMTRAFARTADRLAVWQAQLDRRGAGRRARGGPRRGRLRATVPDRDAAQADRRERSPSWPTSSSRSSSTPGAGTSPPRSPACSPTPTPRRPARASTGIVGFADLVNFTLAGAPDDRARARRSSSSASRRSAPTSSPRTAAASIKTVGDEILFFDRRRGAGRGDRPRPRRDHGRGRPAARRARRHGARPGDLPARRRLRHDRQPGLAASPPSPSRAACSSTTPWPRRCASLSGFELTALRRRTLRGVGQVDPSC